MKTCCLFCVLSLLLVCLPLVHAQEDDIVPVVVALQDLPRGLLLTEDLVLGESAVVGIAFYPADSLPATAVQNLEEIIGYRVRTDIPPDNPLVQHYFYPDPKLQPSAEIPFAISPAGLRVVRDYSVYRELTFDDLDRVDFPARLAAGDTVDVVTTTTLGNPLQDETTFLVQALVIASLTGDAMIFSVTSDQQEVLEAYFVTELPFTLVIRASADRDVEFDSFAEDNRINWDYLLSRDDDPLVIPDGADLSRVGGGQ